MPRSIPDSEPEVSEAMLRGVIEGRIGDRLTEGGDSLAPQRRLITALFADVSGFTALADRLEPEELLEVIDPVITGLSSVVRKFEGYIEKFAGDALLALFGAPVAHEDDAERALQCALEMHRELARIVRELPEQPELTLHVGVNSGHGIGRLLGSEARTDYAVLGDSVILAQRLESAAPPGETYVSQLTYELTDHRFEFDSVGELTLKGKAKPVLAWQLLRERSRPEERPVAPRRLVGRDDELSALTTVLDAVVGGGGGSVTMTGDAGIGKSRLTEEARARAEALNIRWLDARCLSYGATLPYWPYADLLRSFAGITGDEKPVDAALRLEATFAQSPAIPYFARLLGLPAPEHDADTDQLDPEEFRHRLHQAFRDWITELAAEHATVLSLEDVHWADSSSLELTRELVEAAHGAQFVMYLIGRPEAKDRLAELAPDAVRLEVGPLGDEQVESVIESVLEGSPPRQLGRIVRQHTGGNPFFVLELITSLRETGDLVVHNGVWRLRSGWEPTDLPPTLEAVLAARIDLLSVPDVNTLHAASVVGRRVRLPLLHAITTDVADVEQSLARLVAAGFLDATREQDGDALLFHHALVQDVAYGQLLRGRRRELHLRVADVAESLYGAGDDTVDLLARHLYLGQAGRRAVPYLVRAGERDRSLFANDEAILHFTRAAELAPDDMEALLRLGDLYELVGEYDEALQHYEQVRDTTNDVRAWHGSASTLRKQGKYVEALAKIDSAFATPALREHDLTSLWLEGGWTLSVTGRYDQAIDVFQAGLEVSDGRRDADTAQLLVQLARSDALEGRYDEALEHALESERICEERNDLRTLVTALRVVGSAYWYLERNEEASAVLRRGLELAERVGSAEEIGACLMNLALVAKSREDYDEAIQWERQAITEFERSRHASGRAQAYANLADSLERSGRLDEALETCEQARELARAIAYPLSIADTTNTLACIKLKREEFIEAAETAEEAARLYFELGAEPQGREMLDLAVEAWEQGGDSERAHAAAARAPLA